MTAWSATQGHVFDRKPFRRLMRRACLLSAVEHEQPAPAHKIDPYVLGGIAIERVHRVWCVDVTYVPIAWGATW